MFSLLEELAIPWGKSKRCGGGSTGNEMRGGLSGTESTKLLHVARALLIMDSVCMA